jgi:hypothetical protein
MPSWSADGSLVVFSAYAAEASDPRAGVNPDAASIVESSVAFDGTAFHFGPPRVLASPVAGSNLLRPTLSPDGAAAAFTTAGTGGASVTSTAARVSIVRRSDGHLFDATAGNGPSGAWDTRTPDWGPSGTRYAWVAAASARPYGHLTTAAQALRQVWIFAVDRAKLAAGDADPTLPAFHAPGQSLTGMYNHAQWPLAAPPLTP